MLITRFLERSWTSPSPERLRETAAAIADLTLPDEKDRPILAGALATGSTCLLSKDKETFPQGAGIGQLVFWHPDAFLTALFEDNSEVYETVIEELRLLPSDGSLFPHG